MLVHLSRRALSLVPALIAFVALAAAPPAHAGPLVASAQDCGPQKLEQPFLPWADPARYVLAPDGDFEVGATRWTLTNAEVAAENEPFHVHDPDDRASLELQPGGSATSAAMCVGIQHPTLRFFARNTGSPLASLRVDVLYEDALGTSRTLTIGRVIGQPDWAPTGMMPLTVNLLALLPGQLTPVAFRFTAEGADSSWRIDDVYVDPYCK